jgi:hypothetical protein
VVETGLQQKSLELISVVSIEVLTAVTLKFIAFSDARPYSLAEGADVSDELFPTVFI